MGTLAGRCHPAQWLSETQRCWRQGENESLMNLELFRHSSLQTGTTMSASTLGLRPALWGTFSWAAVPARLAAFRGYCLLLRLPLPLPVGITGGLQRMDK